jgi:hypothetical protein
MSKSITTLLVLIFGGAAALGVGLFLLAQRETPDRSCPVIALAEPLSLANAKLQGGLILPVANDPQITLRVPRDNAMPCLRVLVNTPKRDALVVYLPDEHQAADRFVGSRLISEPLIPGVNDVVVRLPSWTSGRQIRLDPVSGSALDAKVTKISFGTFHRNMFSVK